MQRFLRQLIPFVFAGFILVAFLFSAIVFFYLFLFGTLVGALLFTVAWIRQKFFSPTLPATKKAAPHKKGRIIDSNDWDRL